MTDALLEGYLSYWDAGKLESWVVRLLEYFLPLCAFGWML